MKSTVFLILIFLTISSVIGPPSQDGDTTEVVEVIEWNREKYTPQENQRYPALITEGSYFEVVEKMYTDLEQTLACLPENEDEMLTNSQECITKNCLVIKKIIPKDERESEKICTQKYAPSMIWNRTTRSVETGYEIRFSKTKFFREEFLRNLGDTSEAFAGIIDNMIPQSHEIGKAKKSKTTSIWGFIWKSALQIQFDRELNIPRQVKFENLWYGGTATEGECSNYTIIEGRTYQIQDLDEYYSPENQSKMLAGLKPFLTQENFFGRTGKREIPKTTDLCGLPSGCLVQKQLVPYSYYGHRAYKEATCTQLNTLPIWESVAGKTWKRLENLLQSFYNHRMSIKIITGTAGILQLPIQNSEAKRNIFLNFEKRTIAVPKLVYKLVTYTTSDKPHQNNYNYVMVIIIHNDPTLLVWSSIVCQKSVCAENGWEEIENMDYETGLIYCCQPTAEVLKKLEMSSDDVRFYAQYRTFCLNKFYVYDTYFERVVQKKFEITRLGNDKYSLEEIEEQHYMSSG